MGLNVLGMVELRCFPIQIWKMMTENRSAMPRLTYVRFQIWREIWFWRPTRKRLEMRLSQIPQSNIDTAVGETKIGGDSMCALSGP